jgi:hypothetical protein
MYNSIMHSRVPVLLILLILCSRSALSQAGLGAIQGTVKDVSGAVVPGAKVAATHVQTARPYTTTSNEVGFYIFPAIQSGDYSITIEAAGMEAFKGTFFLQTGQTAVVDAMLKVGASVTEVTVAADVAPLVTTTAPTLAQVTDRARIDQLPISGRMFQTLVAQTTPGIDGPSMMPWVWGIKYGLEFVQDGASLENRDIGEINGRPPGMDTIEEFRVETSNSSAKLKRPGTVIVSTRGGSNQLHGSLFEIARNNNLGFGVARARQDRWTRPPHMVRNEFGGSVGAPVYLPKLYNGKNRTFFFYSHESYRALTATTRGAQLPTMAMREGDFSGLVDSSGRRYTLYDPWSTAGAAQNWTRVPFLNNRIPVSRMSPLAKYLYSVTPVPTDPDVNPLVAPNYWHLGPNNRLEWTTTGRVDHRLTDRSQIFFRYTHGVRDSYAQAGVNPITLDKSANGNWRPIRNDTGVVNWTHSFSPTFFSEMSFNVGAEDLNFINVGDDKKYADILGLPNPFDEYGFPNITSTGVGMEYITSSNRRNAIIHIYNLDENLTKIHGRHTMMFGARFKYEKLNVLPDQQQVQGAHTPASLATGLYDPTSGSAYSPVPFTGHNTANLFIGVMGSYSTQFVRKWYDMHDYEHAFYFQDDWKVTNRLTFNLGLRWEIYTPIREANNVLTGFDPTTKSIVNGADFETMYRTKSSTPAIVKIFAQDLGIKFVRPSEVGLPDGLIHLNKWDFNPRAGFAYTIREGNRPLVVRGGYGIYAYPMPLRDFNARMRLNPPTTARFTYSLGNSAQTPDRLPSWGLRSVPDMIAGVNSRDVLDVNSPAGVSRGSFSVVYFNPDQPTSRAHQWNLTFEKELFQETLLKFGYVGSHGSRLDMFYSYNQQPNNYVWFTNTGLPLPTGTYAGTARRVFENTTFGEIEEYRKDGWSNSQNFQIELQRRYSKGLGFQIFYVMSNTLKAGGSGWSDDMLPPADIYLPGAVPKDSNERARFLFYRRDVDIPKHRINWNWIVDLPFGKGKSIYAGAGSVMNRIVGGWQLAGQGSVRSNWWTLPTDNWVYPNEVEIYGTKYKVQDCRSGVCQDGYLYYNGYIPANRINSYGPDGKPNGVMGVPENYKPAHIPLIPMPKDGGRPSDPLYGFYDSNTVWIPMKDGSLQRTTIDTGLNPWRNQYRLGLMSWDQHASLFKIIPVNERVAFRLNIDFFNVFNMPGIPKTPNNLTGIINAQSSGNGARSLQFGLRLNW